MKLRPSRSRWPVAVLAALLFGAARWLDLLTDRSRSIVAVVATLCLLVGGLLGATRTTSPSRRALLGMSVLLPTSLGLSATVSLGSFDPEGISHLGATAAIAFATFVASMVLLSWGLVREITPLMPRASRNRALVDSAFAVLLITATIWNLLLATETNAASVVHHIAVVATLFLLLTPTAFAAAGSVNDPTDRRLKLLAFACAAAVVAGVAGLVGPAMGRSAWLFEPLALLATLLLADALATPSNGHRPSIDMLDRLIRRRRVILVLHLLFMGTLLCAMWISAEHIVMGLLTALVLVMDIGVQSTSGRENIQLHRQLAQQLDDLAISEDRFRRQASTDELTGLMNRRSFVERLDRELKRDQQLAILFIDLDRFKEINDTHGHEAGDELLVVLARRIRATLGSTASIARLGGDEFIVLLPDTAMPRIAVAWGHRLLDAMTTSVKAGAFETFIAASIGIAVSSPDSTAAELISDADAAMYEAKSLGRSRLAVFDPSMRTQAAERLRIANELHGALEHGELEAFFQPIIRLDDDSVSGFEALVRWNHPDRGLLAPGEFLDVAEATGLIVPIGAVVLSSACQQLGAWIRDGVVGPTTTVAVNLAPRQLADRTVVALVADAVTNAGIEPRNLILEITESALMTESGEVDVVMSELRLLGVRFSVDDFGTGYSSLTYLKRFPVEILKVDRDFVSGVPIRSGDTVIVNAVVRLAEALGLTCVAEGIERPEQIEHLLSIGCSHGQGYHFARPMAAPDVAAWLARRADAVLRV